MLFLKSSVHACSHKCKKSKALACVCIVQFTLSASGSGGARGACKGTGIKVSTLYTRICIHMHVHMCVGIYQHFWSAWNACYCQHMPVATMQSVTPDAHTYAHTNIHIYVNCDSYFWRPNVCWQILAHIHVSKWKHGFKCMEMYMHK